MTTCDLRRAGEMKWRVVVICPRESVAKATCQVLRRATRLRSPSLSATRSAIAPPLPPRRVPPPSPAQLGWHERPPSQPPPPPENTVAEHLLLPSPPSTSFSTPTMGEDSTTMGKNGAHMGVAAREENVWTLRFMLYLFLVWSSHEK